MWAVAPRFIEDACALSFASNCSCVSLTMAASKQIDRVDTSRVRLRRLTWQTALPRVVSRWWQVR